MSAIGIGSKLWRFDQNRRFYAPPENKGGFGKLIWREHWVPMVVCGETRVSWLVGYAPSAINRHRTPSVTHKLPKAEFRNGGCPRDWALSEEHLDELAWAEENRCRLSDLVQRCNDPKVLRAVDEVLRGGAR
jgi:hypothetical protein